MSVLASSGNQDLALLWVVSSIENSESFRVCFGSILEGILRDQL